MEGCHEQERKGKTEMANIERGAYECFIKKKCFYIIESIHTLHFSEIK